LIPFFQRLRMFILYGERSGRHRYTSPERLDHERLLDEINNKMKHKFLSFFAPSIILSIVFGALLFVFSLSNGYFAEVIGDVLLFLYGEPFETGYRHWWPKDFTVLQLFSVIIPIAIVIGVIVFIVRYAAATSKIAKLEYTMSKIRLKQAQVELYNSEPAENAEKITESEPNSMSNVVPEERSTTQRPQNAFLVALMKVSDRYLDRYYNQTEVQANKSFKVSLAVGMFGLVVISLGIALLFMGETSPAYVTTAAGVLSEFISAVFFFLYNSTVKSMSKYHNKLVLSQNISIALRVAEDLPDDIKGQAKADLIKQLVQDVNMHIVREEK